ncbi:MAG: hypothetical protein IKO61_08215 [Lachnospiraceae bacterium]|nr:hypothetical protein [Lachnospiraceae bacterium]
MDRNKRDLITLILNILIAVCGTIGFVIMMVINSSATGLTADGLANFKFYTVLSNVLCTVVAYAWLVWYIVKGRSSDGGCSKAMGMAKLMTAAAVGVTFMTIAAFLGPIYGHSLLYKGSNLWFHLIVPLIAMAEFLVFDTRVEFGVKHCLLSVIPTIAYGLFYLINLLVNGVGEWPDTNDWYGFVNWGLPVGMCIFAGIILITFGIAAALVAIRKKFKKQ